MISDATGTRKNITKELNQGMLANLSELSMHLYSEISSTCQLVLYPGI